MVAAVALSGTALNGTMRTKAESALYSDAEHKLASSAAGDNSVSGRGIKRELDAVDSGYASDSDRAPVKKEIRMERRRSVRFADEIDSALEIVYDIPKKEFTWPYGSISGDSFPQAFSEYAHLYAKDVDCSQFVASTDVQPAADADLDCFNDIRSCVGKSFLMMDGSVVRGVCATSRGLYGKQFVKLEALVEQGDVAAPLAGLRPADYIETDHYVQIKRDEVASICRMLCVDNDLATSAPKDSTLDSLTATESTHNGKKLKVFFYSWYCCTAKRSAHPYLADGSRRVSIFWPEDRTWYDGVLENVVDGLHIVVYDVDRSVEHVNLLQLREQGCLLFLN